MNIINPNLLNNDFFYVKNEIKQNIEENLEKNVSFKDILENSFENTNVQFSKHACMRLENRDINLSNSQLKRLEQGIEMAKQKGIKDSLVLVDNVALVVSVKNNTVVTAIANSKEKVYSNIDGAVIV